MERLAKPYYQSEIQFKICLQYICILIVNILMYIINNRYMLILQQLKTPSPHLEQDKLNVGKIF